MSEIQVFNKQAVSNGTREMTQDRTVLIDLLLIFLGILFRFAWPALWAWTQGQIPNMEDLVSVFLPTLIIAFAGAVVVLAASWSLLQQADRRVRWAFAFSYGVAAAWVAQAPAETALATMGIVP